MKKMSLRVDGITCAGCAVDGETVLRNTDGILDAAVRYADGTVTVDYHPEEIDERQVVGLVKKLGWTVTHHQLP